MISNYVKIKFSKFNEYIYLLSVSASILDTISVIGISVKSSIGATLMMLVLALFEVPESQCTILAFYFILPT